MQSFFRDSSGGRRTSHGHGGHVFGFRTSCVERRNDNDRWRNSANPLKKKRAHRQKKIGRKTILKIRFSERDECPATT